MPRLVAWADFQGGYSTDSINRLEIREGFSKHGLAIVDFPVPRSALSGTVAEGTPMFVKWGNGPLDVRTFYGYVNHSETVTDANQSFLRYFCVGTSLPLNEPNPSSWSDVSASFIAKEVATRHGLRAVVSRAPNVLPYWTQGNKSDFAMMKALAEHTGFRFWVDGSTLYFVDPLVLVRNFQYAPSLVMHGQKTDNLKSIHVVSGSLAPRGGSRAAIKHVYGLDANAKALIEASSAKPLADRGLAAPQHREISTVTVDSLEEARRVVESAAMTTDWVTTEAQVEGNSRLRVGGLAVLSGGALHREYHGRWLVSGMTHVLEPGNSGEWQFTSELELSRNQQDEAFFSLSSGNESASREVPAALRRNSYWESQILESVYV